MGLVLSHSGAENLHRSGIKTEEKHMRADTIGCKMGCSGHLTEHQLSDLSSSGIFAYLCIILLCPMGTCAARRKCQLLVEQREWIWYQLLESDWG